MQVENKYQGVGERNYVEQNKFWNQGTSKRGQIDFDKAQSEGHHHKAGNQQETHSWVGALVGDIMMHALLA